MPSGGHLVNLPCRALGLVLFFGAVVSESSTCLAVESASTAIDRLFTAAWAREKIQPAALADDPEFVRRIYLDLIGRIPTHDEVVGFCCDSDPAKRSRLIDELLASGEFAKHWRENLNTRLMGSPAFAGDAQWRAWLEIALAQNKHWDEMARAILRGQPEKSGADGASAFLVTRLGQGDSGLDAVTRDVSRIFFGVDIQCARCHKHPEVKQWKQEYYWGMAAYFNRSYLISIRGKKYLAERAGGEVHYAGKNNDQVAAQAMFLTGEKLDEPRPRSRSTAPANAKGQPAGSPAMDDPADYVVLPEATKDKTRVPMPRFSRRARFIETAINGREPFFKRAAVNYVWAQLFGRGLVEPIDQMHEANPPSQPEVLQFLADDFVAHQFDLRYLIRTVTNTRVYQLSSRAATLPADGTFALSQVRPLTGQQLAMSLLVATGYYEALKAGADASGHATAGELRGKLETQYAATLAKLVRELDPGTDPYQPGIRETLFETNSPTFADLISKGGLVAKLVSLKDDDALVQDAFLSLLSRAPAREERRRLQSYLKSRPGHRRAGCEQIVWALVACSEFRFNH
jgi:Protein of unknown function (DUF1549)/Protein of unknown function (DUF1553)